MFPLKPGEAVLGCLRYFQICHYVIDFPPFPGSEWDEFIHVADQLIERNLHLSLGIGFEETLRGPAIDVAGCNAISAELEFTTIIHPKTRRIRLDIGGDVWGLAFGARFPDLAEKLFREALCIPGFISY